jgi:hypothetical protein
MRTRNNWTMGKGTVGRMLVASGCAFLGTQTMTRVAWAQVVTPPPAVVPAPGDNIPKYPVVAPPPPRPDTVPQFNPQNVKPLDVAQPGAQTAPPAVTLPDLPYTALAQKDEAGNYKPLTEPLQLAAMRVNPTIKEGFLATIRPQLDDRRTAIESLLVANLDLIERVEDGLFESVDFSNRDTIRTLLDAVKPLSHPAGPRPLGEDLVQKQIIDQTQRLFNDKIAREYTLAVVPAATSDAPAEVRGKRSGQRLIALYKQNIDEYTFIYAKAQQYAITNFDSVLAGVELDDAAKQKARDVGAKIASAPAAEKLAALKALREALTLDERKAFYKKAIALAGPAY